MVGFTSLGHQFDPETVREAMTSFFRALATCVRARGGYVEKFIGDAMMSVFGAPVLREDDAERALATAIELHEVLAEVNREWSKRLGRTIMIRVGVNTGIAVAGPIGEGRATDYGVCGDCVSVAARLQGAADPGQTVVGEGTRELGGRGFLFEPTAPLTLKGKPEPIGAFRLLGRAEGVTELFTEAPLVGRDAELARLRQAVFEACAGAGGAVALQGETGAGKSRLLEALRRDKALADALWVGLRPGAETATGALAGARAIARALLPHLARKDASFPSLARTLLGADDDVTTGLVAWLLNPDDVPADSPVAALEPARRAELLGRLFVALAHLAARERPVVIGVDDADALDAASLALLAELGRRIAANASPNGDVDGSANGHADGSADGHAADAAGGAGGAVVVVTTSPTTWTPPWPVQESIPLGDLAPEDLRQLIRTVVGDAEVEEAAAMRLVEHAGGNPLALIELVAAYRQSGKLPVGAKGGVAHTILALIASRIDAVDEDAKRALQVASVVGERFDRAVLGDLLVNSDVGGALKRLARRNLVRELDGESCQFVQRVIRDVAYEGLLFADRRDLHGQVGAWFEALGTDDPHLLAHHYAAGADDAAAAAALSQAADAHVQSYEVVLALEDYAAALRRLGDRDELGELRRAEVLGRMADARSMIGEHDAAVLDYTDAVDAAPPGTLLHADLLRRCARAEHHRGATELVFDCLARARDDVVMAEMEGADTVEDIFTALAALGSAAAQIHFSSGDLEGAASEARQAIEMMSHLPPEVAEAATARRPLAEANLVLAEALLAKGDWERVAEHANAARAASTALHDVALGLRAEVALGRARAGAGSYEEASARCQAALELAERLGDRVSHALALRGLGEGESGAGRIDAAGRAFSRAAVLFADLGMTADAQRCELMASLFGAGATR